MPASKFAALVGVIAVIAVASCRGSAPTSPGGATSSGADVLGVDVSCPTSLLIGQRGPCVAVARLRSGQTPIVSFETAWSSNHPDIVTVDAQGLASGKSAGQATVLASYRDRKADVTVVVTAEDALRIDSGQAHQGDFTPGSTVTMWLQGYYSVASAETGRLSLRILGDQTRTIAATPPVTVAKGGDFFLLSSTFVVPDDSVEVCRTAILEVGSVTIAEPKSKSFPLWCIPIRR